MNLCWVDSSISPSSATHIDWFCRLFWIICKYIHLDVLNLLNVSIRCIPSVFKSPVISQISDPPWMDPNVKLRAQSPPSLKFRRCAPATVERQASSYEVSFIFTDGYRPINCFGQVWLTEMCTRRLCKAAVLLHRWKAGANPRPLRHRRTKTARRSSSSPPRPREPKEPGEKEKESKRDGRKWPWISRVFGSPARRRSRSAHVFSSETSRRTSRRRSWGTCSPSTGTSARFSSTGTGGSALSAWWAWCNANFFNYAVEMCCFYRLKLTSFF